MVSISGGSFTMGDPLDGESDASPTLTVTLSSYFMDSNLVSSSVWSTVMLYANANGYSIPSGSALGANYPMESVTWYDAVKWCNARSQMAGVTPVYYTDSNMTQVYKTGNVDALYVNWNVSGYRLPTEAEWENAARGGLSGQRFPNGNTISFSQACYTGDPYNAGSQSGYSYDLATSNGISPPWYVNTGFSTNANTSTVGYYPPNGYGLYDMAGNVYEWCWDWYGSYSNSPQTNPHGPATGTNRVVRGGSWDFSAYSCRSAYRGGLYPPSANHNFTGFRTVLPQVQFGTVSLQASPSNEGSVSGGGGPVLTNLGILATNRATANNGFEFVNWTLNGTVVSTSTPYIFAITTNETLVANFGPTNYNITVVSSPAAASSVSSESGTFQSGSSATFAAVANAGYVFNNWSIGGVVQTNSADYSFTVTSNVTLTANFSVVNVTNTVNSSSVIEGTVSPSGPTLVQLDSTVTNIATPNTGYQFVNWTVGGNVVSTVPTYIFTITSNQTTVANFTPQQYTITALGYPPIGGNVSGGGTFTLSNNVTLTATTNAGYNFAYWTVNGTLVSSANPYIFPATATETVEAIFTLTSTGNTVTLVPYPATNGTVTGGGTVPTGTQITNSATPDTGYQFQNWMTNGVIVSTNNPYIFTVSNDEILIGMFAPVDFTSTVIAYPTAGGSVGGGGTYLTGTVITNTATTNTGYQFLNWTENGVSVNASNNYVYTITNNRTLVANFSPINFTVSVVAYPSGTGIVSGGGTIPQGNLLTNTASANGGYVFTNWTVNGVQVSTTTPYTFAVVSNETLVANFVPINYTSTVIANPAAGGGVSGGGTFLSGSQVVSIATPSSGYAFTNWTVNGVPVSTSATYTNTLTGNQTLVANFVQVNFTATITAYPAAGGSVGGGGTFPMGTSVTNLAIPNTGYFFTNWTENGVQVSTSPSYIYTLTGNRDLVANFMPVNATITVLANPIGGGAVSGGGNFLLGTSSTNLATPSASYQFVNWTVNGASVSTSSNYSFTVTSNETLVANFSQVNFAVTAVPYPDSGGVVTGSGVYPAGTVITNTETTNGNFQFVNWTVNGTVVSSASNYSFTVSTNTTVVANFEPSTGANTITLVAYPTTEGTVTGGGYVPTGSIITNSATNNPGFAFVDWTLDDGTYVTNSASFSMTVTNDEVLVANFEPVIYDVTLVAYPIGGGAVSGGGATNVSMLITNTATPSNGYQFVDWTTNGVVVSTSNIYVLTVSNDETLVANFSPINFNSTVIAYPSAGGTVSGGGTYLMGSTITNIALTNLGYQFTNWTSNGVVVSTNSNYIFTINSNVTLVATFTPINFTINAVAYPGGGGTVSGGGVFPVGTVITNTATPNTGYLFTNWMVNGAVVGTSTNYILTVASNETVVANFAPTNNTVTVIAAPTNGGTVSGGGSYLFGATVTNLAAPAAGYSFVNWTENGAQVSASASYIYTLVTNRVLVANFTPVDFTVNVLAYPATNGSVTGGGTLVLSGTLLTNTATASNGYQFNNWTVNGVQVSAANPYIFAIASNETLVGNFVPSSFTVTDVANPVAGGTVSGGGTALSNSPVTNIATANTGYQFTNWTVGGASVSTTSNYTFNVTSNRTLVANFNPINFTETVTAYPTGSGTVSGGGTFLNGATVTNIATAATGYQFTNWTVNGVQVSTSSNYTFTITTNLTQVGNFVPVNVTISLVAYQTGTGSVSGGGTVLSGTLVTNTAAASNGYQFNNWTVNGVQVSASNPYTFTATSNETLVANFVPVSFTVTDVANPVVGGSVGGGGTVLSNALVTNTAVANTGYQFTNWTVGGTVVSSSTPYSFAVTSNRTLVANFNQVDFTATVIAYPSAGGSVSGGGTFLTGALVTNTETANTGYQFTNWTVNGVQVSTANPYIFAIASNETLVANFTPIYYTATVIAAPTNGGTVAGGGSYLMNTLVTNTATVAAGYQFVNWTANGVQVSASSNYVYTITTNVILTANFTPVDFTVSVIAYPSGNGAVTGGGTFLMGTSVTNHATAATGYQFTNWTVNGVQASTANPYIFAVASNETLVGNFIPVNFTVTTLPYPTDEGTVAGGGTFLGGSLSTNIAQTNGGFRFVNWTVNGSIVSTSTNYVFTVTTNVTLVGNFEPIGTTATISLIANPAEGGTVSGGGTVPTNSLVTNIATANVGYQFINWTTNGVQASPSNTYIFLATNDEILIANFTPTSNTLTVMINPILGGSATGSGTYPTGTVVTNTATPSNGYAFFNWTTNGIQASTSNNYVVTLTNDQTIVANFMNTNGFTGTSNTVTVVSSPSTGSMANINGAFLTGSVATVTVTPNLGYQFMNWMSNGVVVSTSSTYQFQVMTNVTLTANFALAPLIVTVNSSPTNGGTVSGGGSYTAGSGVTNLATAANGYEFIGWTGDATGTANPLTYTLTGNKNITANFASTGANTLTVLTSGGGSVSPMVNGESFPANKSITLTATADSGYQFAGWTGSETSSENPLVVTMTNSLVLQANFVSALFPTAKGTFNGLFATSNVTQQTAGMLKGLSINSKGVFSGTILFNGASAPFSGSFSSTGLVTKEVTIKSGGSLTVTMQLANSNGAPQINGTVSSTAGWTANLTAYFSSSTTATTQYTILIAPPTNAPPTNSPGGEGYLSITDSKGTIKLTGALADGTTVSQTTSVSQDGYVPVYASLYKNQGLLLGWVNLGGVNTNAIGLTWINPGSSLYSAGFTDTVPSNQVTASLWTVPENISSLTNLLLEATTNGANATPILVSIDANTGKLTGSSPLGAVSGSVNTKTGLLSVTIGAGANKLSGFGAVVLNGTNLAGGGYFLNKTNKPVQAQAIQLTP